MSEMQYSDNKHNKLQLLSKKYAFLRVPSFDDRHTTQLLHDTSVQPKSRVTSNHMIHPYDQSRSPAPTNKII